MYKYDDKRLVAVEARDMVATGLAVMSEEDKNRVLTAYMLGQCTMYSKNYTLTEVEQLTKELTSLYAIFGDKAETKAIYHTLMDMLNDILKGLGRLEYARYHGTLEHIDLYSE